MTGNKGEHFGEMISLVSISSAWDQLSPLMRQGVMALGALVLVAFGLFLWVALFRTGRRDPRTRHERHQRSDENTSGSGRAAAGTSDLPSDHRRRRRRRRREHRPRNPTLAETGGLPPIRNKPPETPT